MLKLSGNLSEVGFYLFFALRPSKSTLSFHLNHTYSSSRLKRLDPRVKLRFEVLFKKFQPRVNLITLFLTIIYLLNTIKPFSGNENRSLGPTEAGAFLYGKISNSKIDKCCKSKSCGHSLGTIFVLRLFKILSADGRGLVVKGETQDQKRIEGGTRRRRRRNFGLG
jgi:hypothetical protein